MADNQTEFVFSAKDDVTPVVQGVIKALGQLDVAGGGADKTLGKLESTMAGAINKFAGLDAAASKTAGNLSKTESAYTKNLQVVSQLGNKVGQLTQAANGKFQGAGGKFLSDADVQRYQTAATNVGALNKSYALMQQTQKGLATRDLQKALQSEVDGFNKSATAAEKFNAILQNVPPNSTRYALYDASASLAVLGAAMLAGGVASIKFATDFERSFADVKRTVNDLDAQGLEGLQKDLVELSTQIPVTFGDLSKIASLGGQLGISGTGIDEFTESIAKISTVSDLSIDQAATAFGRFKALLGVSEQEFDNLSSSILKVGVNSVATESQIVNISTQIASMADYAGFTADQVIGLSGALASIGAPPELSRGLVTRLFAKMGDAVAEGGTALQSFAQVSGVSSDDFVKAWGTEKFAGTFEKFMTGLKDSGGDAINILKQLGITSVRDVPLLLRLANAADSAGKAGGLLAQTMNDAEKGWKDNTELQRQYAIITNTVAERLKILGNTFAALFAAIGAPALGALQGLINGLSGFVTIIAGNQVITSILGIAVAVGVLLGSLLLLAAGLARAGGAILGMQQATAGLVGSFVASKVALAEMNATLGVTSGVAARSGVALRGFGAAVGAALGPIGIAITLLSALVALAPTISDSLNDATGRTQTFSAALDRLKANAGSSFNIVSLGTASNFEAFAKLPLDAIKNYRALGFVAGGTSEDIKKLDEQMAAHVAKGDVTTTAAEYAGLRAQWIAAGGNAKGFAAAFTDTTEALKGAAPAVKGVKGEIASIADVSDEAVDRYDAMIQAIQSGSAAFINTGNLIKTNQADQQAAFQATATAGMDAADVTGDEWQQFYDGQTVNLANYLVQLQAAADAQKVWGDNLKTLGERGVGEEILTDLAKLGPEGAPLVQALVDGTDAQLQQYVELWKKAGKDSGEALATSTVLTQFVIENAFKALGSGSQAAFVEALQSGDPINEVLNKFNLDSAGNPIKIWSDNDPAYANTNAYLAWARSQTATITVRTAISSDGSISRVLPGIGSYNDNYATGGYTGAGGKYDIAGAVHRGEFVFDKESTSAIGPDQLYSMMRAARGGRSVKKNGGFAGGGYAGGGTAVVELGPKSLRAVSTNVINYLKVGNETIANAANSGNNNRSRRGGK